MQTKTTRATRTAFTVDTDVSANSFSFEDKELIAIRLERLFNGNEVRVDSAKVKDTFKWNLQVVIWFDGECTNTNAEINRIVTAVILGVKPGI